ncbi:MAG TPA: ABC transporter substrate-binding protein [Trebonia sp.]|nr:ABC transporter substrate-binding protein [Trebonia sp.]
MREIRGFSRRFAGRRDRPSRGGRRLHGLLAVAVAGAAAAGCGSGTGHQAGAGPSSPEAAGRPVIVAAVPAPGAAALYIAGQRGLFAKAGLDVRIESSVSASDVVPDLVNGSVSVALGQWTSALAAAAGGVKLKVIAPGNSGGPGLEELVAKPGSGITKVAQLRGKVIAVNALGGLPQALTDSVLAADGVPAAAVRYTAVPFPSMAAALAAGKVAAAFMVAPYLTQATGQVRALADIDQASKTRQIPVTGYYASQAWAGAHAARLAAFAAALAQGQKIAATNPAAARQAVARYTGVSGAVAAKMPLGTFPASVDAADLGRVGALMQAYGLLPRGVKVTALASGLTS